MTIYENGKYRDATEAEAACLEAGKGKMPVPAPGVEQRLAALEAKAAALELKMERL